MRGLRLINQTVRKPLQEGLTLLELLITLAILSIVLGAGVPTMLEMARETRLRGAAQETYGLLQYARSDALRAGADRFVVWSVADGQWCEVVTTSNSCNCFTDDCSIDGVLRQQQGNDFADINLLEANFAAGSYTRFDGLRGLANGNAGSVRYQLATASGPELRVVVSALGRLRYCRVGDISGYPEC